MTHSSWKNILFNISLCLNCLLVFLHIFEDRLSLPVWLQVTGRTHPLILHFPIVLVVMYIVAIWLLPRKTTTDPFADAKDILLLLASMTAAITALAGLFLSREEGYDAEAIQGHKLSGIGLSVLLLLWYSARKFITRNKITTVVASASALFLIVFAGHRGSVITHGEGFILAPARPEKKIPVVSPEEAEVFTHLLKPILENKCITCHNARKAKGELIMETKELLLKGGKSGVLWDSTAEDFGLMLQRVHLPIAAKKHMPPEGKPQLTDEEIAVLEQWIRRGADFNLKVADLPTGDTLKQIASNMLLNAELNEYDFDEADAFTVSKLNTENRSVSKLAEHSPALIVSFFNRSLFQAQQLKELLPVKTQIVSLDLTGMGVKDADLATIAEMSNLRRLNLSNTEITGATLQDLKKLKYLRSLSLSGTAVQQNGLLQLQGFPQLKTVYAWNVPVKVDDMQKVHDQLKNIRFEKGFRADTTILKLSPPIAQNEQYVLAKPIALQLKHYIKGTTIRYTVDGSDPDSTHSVVYDGKYMVDDVIQVKARAFKPGWKSSDVTEMWFYKSGYHPDSLLYLTTPNPRYKGDSARILIDLDKGDNNFRSGKWVGYHGVRMECLLPFSSPIDVERVAISSLVDIGSHIMPPASFEVWGGNEIHSLKLLGKIKPAQPDSAGPSYMRPFECAFDKTSVKYIKLVVIPVVKLPKWHTAKGEKGWIFIDEILVN